VGVGTKAVNLVYRSTTKKKEQKPKQTEPRESSGRGGAQGGLGTVGKGRGLTEPTDEGGGLRRTQQKRGGKVEMDQAICEWVVGCIKPVKKVGDWNETTLPRGRD